MTEQILSVPDISCDHCKMTIEEALSQLSGVDAANVDIAAKTVALSFNESAVSLDEIVDTLTHVGYEVAR
jgi:copper ion binding protein